FLTFIAQRTNRSELAEAYAMKTRVLILLVVGLSFGVAALAEPKVSVTTTNRSDENKDIVDLSEQLVSAQALGQLSFYNTLSASLNLPQVSCVAIRLTYDAQPKAPTGGNTESKELSSVSYSQSPFDLTIVAHELGHIIHKIVGPSDDQILFDPQNSSAILV